ncbi:MAG: sensor domain-containing diguanylate cyclase [Dethiosulfatibacter sp.]|nr:sensor domain-containing diguanylate cyclase [Dethiosulfatibacter sp.]
MKERFEKFIRMKLFAVVAGLVVFSLFSSLFYNYVTNLRRDLYLQVRNELEEKSDKIALSLTHKLSYVRIIEVFVRDSLQDNHKIDPKSFESFATLICNSSESIITVALSPDGVMQFIYPQGGNEMMIGFDLLAEQTRSEFVQRSIDTRSIVTQGPVDAKQGNIIIISYSPIFIEQDGQEQFWGMVSIAIDFEKFLDIVNIRFSTDLSDYLIHVSAIDGNTDFYYGDRSLLDKKFLADLVVLPGLTWQLYAHPKGSWHRDDYRGIPIFVVGILLTLIVVYCVKKINRKYNVNQENATLDSLTRCQNRFGFDRLLADKANLEKGFALLVIDVDDFKIVNDTFGHNVGDCVLKELTEIFRTAIRQSDDLFRIGGDEFVIILRDLRDQAEIASVVNRLISNAYKCFVFDDQKICVSLSVGIAVSNDEASTIAELYKKADMNLYCEKEKGKNQFVLC